jgi:hypothetical protein
MLRLLRWTLSERGMLIAIYIKVCVLGYFL